MISVCKLKASAKAGIIAGSMVACMGPFATMSCKPRQARKGATVVVTSGAGVWLVWAASIFQTMLQRAASIRYRMMALQRWCGQPKVREPLLRVYTGC